MMAENSETIAGDKSEEGSIMAPDLQQVASSFSVGYVQIRASLHDEKN